MIGPGSVLRNRYEILDTIGRGGMADVYLAFDRRRMVKVAIKVLREDLAEDPDFVRRFAREARALAQLDHPNIVRFYSFEKENYLAFLVMDYVDGNTLRTELARREQPLSLYETTSILHDIGSALFYAHNQGIIHRDLKPGNVLLARDGRALLTDFGIAKALESATVTTMAVGTPAYMSPEQILGKPLDARTDIYSLGVMLFQMVTGRRPFTGDESGLTGTGTLSRLREAHLRIAPPDPREFNPHLPPEASQVILKAMAKEPDERWSDTREMVAAWDQAMAVHGLTSGVLSWRTAAPSEAATGPSRSAYPPLPAQTPTPPVQTPFPPGAAPPPPGATPPVRKRYSWLIAVAVLVIVLPLLWLVLQMRGNASTGNAAPPPSSVSPTVDIAQEPSPTSGSGKASVAATQTAAVLVTQTAREIATKTAAEMATQTAKDVATKVAATKQALDRQATATAKAQRTATAVARVRATETAEAQRIADREEIARVIEEYGDIKVQAMTYLDPSNLSRVLINPVLERKRQTVCWLQKNDAYYTYADRSVDIQDILFQNQNEAYVYAWLAEHITYIQKGQVHDWGYDRYKAVYHLRKVGGQWKIDCLTALKDEESFSPHCEVKFPSTNPCQ